jgi:hypothetical protein
MAIEFACPHCKVRLSAPDELEGKTGQCPKCTGQITVPNKRPDAGEGPATAAP